MAPRCELLSVSICHPCHRLELSRVYAASCPITVGTRFSIPANRKNSGWMNVVTLFLYTSPFPVFGLTPSFRAPQCKWRILEKKGRKDACFLWTLRNVAELDPTLVITVSVLNTLQLILHCTVTLTLVSPQVHTMQKLTYTTTSFCHALCAHSSDP